MGKTKDQEKDIKNKQFTWILANDATEGNKPSDTLMPGSFARATQAINEKFGVECQPNHVENCLRTIKSIWSTITQLRDRKNSFGWDDKLKMITCCEGCFCYIATRRAKGDHYVDLGLERDSRTQNSTKGPKFGPRASGILPKSIFLRTKIIKPK